MNNAVIVLLLFLLASLFAASWLRYWQQKRAARKILDLLWAEGATSPEKAKGLDELKLKRKATFLLFKDWRSIAFRGMLLNGVVEQLEDGRVYMSKEAVEAYTQMQVMRRVMGGRWGDNGSQ